MLKKSKMKFNNLGEVKITDYTTLVLSEGYEDNNFKGYYIGKKYTVKDSQDESKRIEKFALGAYRVDTVEQLEEVSKLFNEVIAQIKNK